MPMIKISYKSNKKNYSFPTRGFSLVEILVALSIFSIVMTIGTAAVLVIVDANQKSQSLGSVMTNLNIALEGMSKNIRTGINYHCGGAGVGQDDCTFGGPSLTFQPSSASDSSDRTTYSLTNGKIIKDDGVTTEDITSPEITVSSLIFYVLGTDDPAFQPIVHIVIRGSAGVKEETKTFFNLQTS